MVKISRTQRNVWTSEKAIEASRMLWQSERQMVSPLQIGAYAGVDEVGRGALAGPVYAAAVILGGMSEDWLGIHDSKQLSRKRREQMEGILRQQALAIGIGMATLEEIEKLNILHASRLAMGRAIHNLPIAPEFVLVDGTYLPLYEQGKPPRGMSVVHGDATCISIAAASIIAKVERDRYMSELATLYPEYGFERHAGYATEFHRAKLRQFGPSACHRKGFMTVKESEQLRLDIL